MCPLPSHPDNSHPMLLAGCTVAFTDEAAVIQGCVQRHCAKGCQIASCNAPYKTASAMCKQETPS
jgi:hypothetical protein